MVFYLLLAGVEERPSATATAGVFERFRSSQTGQPLPSLPASAGQGSSPMTLVQDETEATVDLCMVGAVRLFRESGSGSRSLLVDALPMQRTTVLFLLAVPAEVSVQELQAFLGQRMEDVEAIRVLLRTSCNLCSPSATNGTSLQGFSGDFYSIVILCRSQAGADALYKSNHGRLFPKAGAGASELPPRAQSEEAGAGGPCCYLLFLEAVVYMMLMLSQSRKETGEELAVDNLMAATSVDVPTEDVPAAAYELPACPFCLERLDVSGTGMVTHQQGWLSTTACDRLVGASAKCCRACSTVALATRNALASPAARHVEVDPQSPSSRCKCCTKQEELWVCLVCGHVGCGRYASGHAKDHATEQRHRFCLELSSGRIWDYSGDVFVHRRLVQMAAASGGLFDVTLSAPAVEPAAPASSSKQLWPGQTDILAMELDAILISQLEHHRSLYEARLVELEQEHEAVVQQKVASSDKELCTQSEVHAEIAEAERKRRALERQCATARKSRADSEEQLRFVKELNKSLLENQREIQAAARNGSTTANGVVGDEAKDDDPVVKRLRERVEELMAAISALEETPESPIPENGSKWMRRSCA